MKHSCQTKLVSAKIAVRVFAFQEKSKRVTSLLIIESQPNSHMESNVAQTMTSQSDSITHFMCMMTFEKLSLFIY